MTSKSANSDVIVYGLYTNQFLEIYLHTATTTPILRSKYVLTNIIVVTKILDEIRYI